MRSTHNMYVRYTAKMVWQRLATSSKLYNVI